jgi:ribosomal protein S3AE
MLQGELSKALAHGVKSLYPLKKIEIRRSEVWGTIADEVPPPETAAVPEGPEAPASAEVAEGGGPAA